MKKIYGVLLVSLFLVSFTSCSKDESPSGPEVNSDVAGEWGINMQKYSGNVLDESLDVYLTVTEINGTITGTGTVNYKNGGTNTVEMNLNDNVVGVYQPNQSPNIFLTVGSGTPTPFTFTGDWDEYGVNFHGTVTIYYGGNSYVITDMSYYKRK